MGSQRDLQGPGQGVAGGGCSSFYGTYAVFLAMGFHDGLPTQEATREMGKHHTCNMCPYTENRSQLMCNVCS